MDEWTDSVRIAVDVFVACVIIGALLLCMTLGHKISNYMDLEAAAAADVKDFRTQNAYEGTTVYAQDVVNLILTSDGYPEIYVYKKGTHTPLVWNRTAHASEYTTKAVGNAVGVSSAFSCTLETTNGEVTRFVFNEVEVPASGGVPEVS